MASIPLKQLFPHASTLVYGCMAIGGEWDYNPLTQEQRKHAQTAVNAALEAGITVFDHADIYRMGKAEQVFGNILAAQPSLRDNMVLQSKCGIRFADEQGPKRYDLSKEWIVESVEGSLKRLNTEHLDVLLLHRPDPLVEPDEVAEAFAQLKKQGKVAHFGVSNMHVAQMQRLNAVLDEPLVANQIEMSLTNLGWLEEGIYAGNPEGNQVNFTAGTLEYAQAQSVQLQAWAPLSQGKYTGAPASLNEKEQATANLIHQFAAEYNVAPDAIVLAWLMRHPVGIQPILGSANPARIAQSAKAEHVNLTRAQWYAIYESARQAELP